MDTHRRHKLSQSSLPCLEHLEQLEADAHPLSRRDELRAAM